MENKKVYDYIIVGGGIAGCLLSYHLIESGRDVLILTSPRIKPASHVAAGIINPITGRKFVKSWMYDDLWREAERTYSDLENKFSIDFFKKGIIVRTLNSISAENDWNAKMLHSDYQKYAVKISVNEYQPVLSQSYAHASLKEGGRVEFKTFLDRWEIWMKSRNGWSNTHFEHNDLEIEPGLFRYNNFKSKRIVFCEGWNVVHNPFFKNLAFRPAKGELLIVKIPDFKTNQILKDQLFFVPQYDDVYWVGATYDWDKDDDTPTKEKGIWLKQKLQETLSVPYEILDHKAGIRPSTKYRKPLMGAHSDIEGMYCFNGMGTKGASLTPYFAKHFASYLEENTSLMPEVKLKYK